MLMFMGMSITLIAGASAFGSAPRPSTPRPGFQAVYRWVDSWGKVQKTTWPTRGRWGWTRNGPAFRIQIRFPADVADVQVEAKGARARVVPESRTVWIETRQRLSSATLMYRTSQGTLQSNLIIQLVSKQPLYMLDPGCREQGISVRSVKKGATGLAVGIRCRETEAEIFVTPDLESSSKRVALNPTETSVLARFQVSDRDQREQVTAYEILQGDGPVTKSRWSLTAGLSGTVASYSESHQGIASTTAALVGKFGVAYQIIPNRLNASFSAFGSIWPFLQRPATLESPRYYGLNGRVGYVLPIDWAGLNWSLSGGWYFWGMLVRSNSYGVAYLTGPQIYFFVNRSAGFRNRSFFGYLKWAPLMEGIQLPRLADREIAIGGGYQLNSGRSRHPILLTADISDLFIGIPLGATEARIGLLTVSVGMQISF